MRIETIKTKRLRLRPIEISDAPFFYKLFNSEGWITYIGDRNIKSVADAEKQLTEKYIPSYSIYGYGSYLVEEKTSGLPIGTCGLYKRPNVEDPDIGFAFLTSYMGQGYGYEAAQAVMIHARQHLQLETILAFTVSHNRASIRLLEKLGLHYVQDYSYEGSQEALQLYATQGLSV